MNLTIGKLEQAALEARNQRKYDYYASVKFNYSEIYDLFVSHSFRDRNLVIGLYYLFEKAGYKVYIDWINDSGLNRSSVDSETAALIKARIKQSKGTAYISTENSTSSKWCPWELGVADGMYGKVCILPIMSSAFVGQEYLSLYPYLDYAPIEGSLRYDFWVQDQKNINRYTRLENWLRAHEG